MKLAETWKKHHVLGIGIRIHFQSEIHYLLGYTLHVDEIADKFFDALGHLTTAVSPAH